MALFPGRPATWGSGQDITVLADDDATTVGGTKSHVDGCLTDFLGQRLNVRFHLTEVRGGLRRASSKNLAEVFWTLAPP